MTMDGRSAPMTAANVRHGGAKFEPRNIKKLGRRAASTINLLPVWKTWGCRDWL